MWDYSQNPKLLAISPMIFDLQASYLEYMYKSVRDSGEGHRSRSNGSGSAERFLYVCACVSVCPAFTACISLTMGRTLIKLGENVGTSVQLIVSKVHCATP